MQRGIGPALRTSRGVVAIAVALGALAVLLLVAGPAGAEPGWSRTPASGLPGATIHVASSPATLCQWLAPADPVATVTSPESAPPIGPAAPGDPIVYDGVRIELRLRTGATELAIGAVTVTPGGAWSGDVTVATAATAGEYELVARCIVDDPALDGMRSYDFDPQPFAVVEGPPPTTLVIPTEIDTAIEVTNPVEVAGAGLDRSDTTAPVAAASAPVETLPETGDGTNAVAWSGFGAIALGGLALWFGNRDRRRSLQPASPPRD